MLQRKCHFLYDDHNSKPISAVNEGRGIIFPESSTSISVSHYESDITALGPGRWSVHPHQQFAAFTMCIFNGLWKHTQQSQLLQISVFLDMGHLELLKGESAALQFVGSAHWSMLPGLGGALWAGTTYGKGAGCQFSEQHWHSLTEGQPYRSLWSCLGVTNSQWFKTA